MQKENYFDALDTLARSAERAVYIAANAKRQTSLKDINELCDIAKDASKRARATEDALFSDFLPPLERDSLARSAHIIEGVIDACILCVTSKAPRSHNEKKAAENEECLRLSSILVSSVELLRRIKKPDSTPPLSELHELKCKFFKPSSARHTRAEPIHELRAALYKANCEIIEIMLKNI